MEELKTILDQHSIDWRSPMVIITKKDVVTLSPELIFNKVFDLKSGDRNLLINRFRLLKGNRRKVLSYLDKLGKSIVNAKI